MDCVRFFTALAALPDAEFEEIGIGRVLNEVMALMSEPHTIYGLTFNYATLFFLVVFGGIIVMVLRSTLDL